jgi:mRNA interferase RelE/StbE
MTRIEITPPAEGQIRKLDPALLPRIDANLRRLSVAPDLGKPLQGPLAGLRSLRVGDYRIVYKLYPGQGRLAVLRVAHRREVYR